MSPTKSSSASISTVLILFLLSCSVTIWLFHYLTESTSRSDTFAFTLAFVCFLQLLSFAYFIPPMLSAFKNTVSFAVYPAIGITLLLYVIVSVAIILDYNLFSLLLHSAKAYFTLITVETLLLLIVNGSIVTLNAYKKSEDTEIEVERLRRSRDIVTIQETFDKFIHQKNLFDPKTYHSLESNMKKLKERFDFCTPFGRPGVESLEIEIQNSITRIGQVLDSASTSSPEQKASFTTNLETIISSTIQAVDRREKLLIK